MKILLVLDSAEFGDVRRAIDLEFGAKIVGHAHVVERRAKEVRALGDGATDGDSPRTSAFARQMLRRGELVVDQILSAGDEVGNGVELRGLAAAVMPILAILAAAADMSDRNHTTALQPRERRWIEAGVVSNSVRAVSMQKGGVRAVELESALVNNGERHQGSIRRFGLDLFRFDSRKIHG